MPVYHGMRDRFIEGRRHDSCVTVTIYHGMRDHFIEGRRHDSCVTVTIYHGVCDRFIEPLKARQMGEIKARQFMRKRFETVYREQG